MGGPLSECGIDWVVTNCNQRVAPNSSISKWRRVTSGVPQGLVLGLMLVNIFVSKMDSGLEYTLSNFADETKLCGAVNTLEERDVIQRDHDTFEKRACANLTSSTRSCTWIWAIPSTNIGCAENELREVLQWRTWGCWLTRNSTWPDNLHLQPRKLITCWAAWKELWPASQDRWFWASSPLWWDLTWTIVFSPWQRAWNLMVLKVAFNPKHSMIKMYLCLSLNQDLQNIVPI